MEDVLLRVVFVDGCRPRLKQNWMKRVTLSLPSCFCSMNRCGSRQEIALYLVVTLLKVCVGLI